MESTIGLVHEVTILPFAGLGCASIGPSPGDIELFVIQRTSTDADEVGAFKNSIVDALVAAKAARLHVAVGHEVTSPVIQTLSIQNV